MPFNKLVIFSLSLVFSHFSFSAACPASSDTTTEGNGTCDITGGASTITLNFTSGFSSDTSVTAVDGNNGTTLGAQRKLSFIKAAEIISEQVTSAVTIIVEANFTALSCTTNSATLGSAGASANLSISSSPPTGILVNTFYPIGLYNAITGSDASGAHDDIDANFNSDIGDADCLASSSWYYGFSDASGTEIGFTTVLLHEMTHGLGFASLVDPSDGSQTSGLDDIFSANLYDNVTGLSWNDNSQTDQNREDSAISVDDLLWSGTNVNTNAIGLLTNGFNDVDTDGNFESGDKVEMYAPASVESGSSVSHFTTDATPNELMEPSYTDSLYSLGLALYLLEDIGWGIVEPNNSPTITAVDQTTNEDTAKVVDASGWGSDADSDSLTYTVSSCPANITCAIDSDGQNLTLTPDDDYNGATNTVTIQVDDGNDGITTDDLNLTVSAQNDAPVWSTISEQNTNEDTDLVIDLSGYGTDVDGDSLTYSVTSCATNITCSVSGNDLTLSPTGNYSGATHNITVEVDDSTASAVSTSFNLVVNAQNDAPTWSTISEQNTNEDTDLIIDLSSNASDVDGDSLTYSVTSCATNITCSVSGSNLTLSPDSNHTGSTHNITVEVDDSIASAVSTSFNLVVNAQNDAPTWSTISEQNTNEDTDLVIDLSGYASDVDGDSLTYSVSSCATNITCSISGSNLTLSPDSNHTGSTHNITVEVDDSTASAVSTSFNLIVNAQNDAPTWSTISEQNTNEDTDLVIDLSDYASDNDGDSLTYSVSSCASNITCSVSGSELTLSPESNHIGSTHNITVEVDDSTASAVSTSFNLVVNAQNDAPTWSTISEQNTNEDTDLVIDLSDYGSDVDGDSLTYSVTSCATNITCSVSGSELTLSPDSNHTGATHNITVEVDDSTASAVSTSFNLVVNAQNDAPVWSSISEQNTNEDTDLVIDLSAYASDTESDSLTYSVTSCATNITCSISGSNLTLTPDSNHTGSTHNITVQIDDGNSGTDSTSFNLVVNAQNDAPVWSTISEQNTNEDTDLVIDLSAYASDTEGDSLTYSVTSCASNITCSVSGSNLTLTPDSNHNGATHNITVQIDDGNSGTDSTSFNLIVNTQNDGPSWSAIPDQSIDDGDNVVINLGSYASDTEGDSLTYSATACGSNLTCSISGSSLTLSASGGAGSTVSVTIEADDGNSGTASDSFDVTINTAGNNVPTLTAIDQSTNEDTSLEVDISGWGTDADGDAITYSVSSCASNISCSLSGTSLTLTADDDHNGATHTITLQASDGNGGTVSDSFNIEVLAVNDAPTMSAVDQTTNEDTALVVDISSWGSDIDGDTLTYSVTSCASGISCDLTGDDLTLTPDANHTGTTHTVTLQLSDGNGATITDSFNLEVTQQNDIPVLATVDQTTSEDTSLVIDISAWGSDADDDALTFSISSCATHVTCELVGTSLTLTPENNHNGASHEITLLVTDNNGGSSSDSFNLNVVAINDAPVFAAATDVDLIIGDNHIIDLSSLATDAEDDALIFSILSCGNNLTCNINNDNLQLLASAGDGTSVLVSVQALDENGGAGSYSFNVNISAYSPNTYIEVEGSSYQHDETLTISLQEVQVDVLGGGGSYSYNLEYAGIDVSHLITINDTGLLIALPESGAFTGNYTLAITDDTNNEIIEVTLTRPLRLVWSSTSMLSGDVTQTLTIEGGEAGSQYNISQLQETTLSFKDDNQAVQTLFTAPDDAGSFNGVIAGITNNVVLEITSVEVTVETLNADYPNATDTILVYPMVEHVISVIDESGVAIDDAQGLLAENSLFTELNLELVYTSNDQGQITLQLPDNDELYGFTLTANQFNPATITLEAGVNEYEVILEAMGNSITLSGSISALGTQDFLRNAPAIKLIMDNGDSISVVVTVGNSSQASFSQDVDLNRQVLQTMDIEQADSLNIELDISDLAQNQTFNILLERSIAVVVSTPTTDSGGGALGAFYLFALLLLLSRRIRLKITPQRNAH